MSPPVVVSILRQPGPIRVWFPVRPEGWDGLRQRFRLAWLVFWGRLDAFDIDSIRDGPPFDDEVVPLRPIPYTPEGT